MEILFSSSEELKKRVMPALRIRKRELKKLNYAITEEEIWNYFVEKFWKKSFQLSLYQIVDDILNREIDMHMIKCSFGDGVNEQK